MSPLLGASRCPNNNNILTCASTSICVRISCYDASSVCAFVSGPLFYHITSGRQDFKRPYNEHSVFTAFPADTPCASVTWLGRPLSLMRCSSDSWKLCPHVFVLCPASPGNDRRQVSEAYNFGRVDSLC